MIGKYTYNWYAINRNDEIFAVYVKWEEEFDAVLVKILALKISQLWNKIEETFQNIAQ